MTQRVGMLDIPTREVEHLEETMKRCLHRWRQHPDFEELCGEARLEFWRAVSSDSCEWDRREALIRTICRHVAHRFVTMQCNSQRRSTWNGTPVPQMISFEHFWEWRGTEPDFAPGLIERLWRREVWEQTFSLLDTEERQFVQAWITGERTFSAAEQNELRRLHRMLNRYRDQVGEPLRYNGQFARRGWKKPRQFTDDEIRAHDAARQRERRRKKREACSGAGPLPSENGAV